MDSGMQRQNADPSMKLTLEGMQINFNEHFSKQDFSIRISRDSLSNAIDSSRP
jgi:hypothetical protein